MSAKDKRKMLATGEALVWKAIGKTQIVTQIEFPTFSIDDFLVIQSHPSLPGTDTETCLQVVINLLNISVSHRRVYSTLILELLRCLLFLKNLPPQNSCSSLACFGVAYSTIFNYYPYLKEFTGTQVTQLVIHLTFGVGSGCDLVGGEIDGA